MSTTTKSPYAEIYPIATRLLDAIRPHCLRAEIAGSFRRLRQMVGDIEIVAVPIRPTDLFGHELEDQPTALDRFLDEHNTPFRKRGRKYQQFAYGRQIVDLFLTDQHTWGSIYTIRTGNWEFSRWLVTSQSAGGASPPGLTFHDGRLHANGRLLHTPEEADVFAALGLSYIPPSERNGPPSNPIRVDPIWRYDE